VAEVERKARTLDKRDVCCPTKEAYKWKTSKATLRLDMFG